MLAFYVIICSRLPSQIVNRKISISWGVFLFIKIKNVLLSVILLIVVSFLHPYVYEEI